MKKKLGFALMLAIASSGVLAEWEPIGKNDSATLYMDRSTIRKAGPMVKMWHLIDHKTLQQPAGVKAFRSAKEQQEYDCNAETFRTFYFSNHTEKMGTGNVAHHDNQVQNWTPVAPGSGIEILFKVACGMQ